MPHPRDGNGNAQSLSSVLALSELKALHDRAQALRPFSSQPERVDQTAVVIERAIAAKEKRVGHGISLFQRAAKNVASESQVIDSLRALLHEGAIIDSATAPEVLERRGRQRAQTIAAMQQLSKQPATAEHPGLSSHIREHVAELTRQETMEAWALQAAGARSQRSQTKKRQSAEGETREEDRAALLREAFEAIVKKDDDHPVGQSAITPKCLHAILAESTDSEPVTTREAFYIVNRTDTQQKDGVIDFSEFCQLMAGSEPTVDAFHSVMSGHLVNVRADLQKAQSASARKLALSKGGR